MKCKNCGSSAGYGSDIAKNSDWVLSYFAASNPCVHCHGGWLHKVFETEAELNNFAMTLRQPISAKDSYAYGFEKHGLGYVRRKELSKPFEAQWNGGCHEYC